MGIRFSCPHDDSKNPGTPTDYPKESVSKPGSPSFLNRSYLTQLFAIDLWDQKLQLGKDLLKLRTVSPKLSIVYSPAGSGLLIPSPSALLRRSQTLLVENICTYISIHEILPYNRCFSKGHNPEFLSSISLIDSGSMLGTGSAPGPSTQNFAGHWFCTRF